MKTQIKRIKRKVDVDGCVRVNGIIYFASLLVAGQLVLVCPETRKYSSAHVEGFLAEIQLRSAAI